MGMRICSRTGRSTDETIQSQCPECWASTCHSVVQFSLGLVVRGAVIVEPMLPIASILVQGKINLGIMTSMIRIRFDTER